MIAVGRGKGTLRGRREGRRDGGTKARRHEGWEEKGTKGGRDGAKEGLKKKTWLSAGAESHVSFCEWDVGSNRSGANQHAQNLTEDLLLLDRRQRVGGDDSARRKIATDEEAAQRAGDTNLHIGGHRSADAQQLAVAVNCRVDVVVAGNFDLLDRPMHDEALVWGSKIAKVGQRADVSV